MEVELIQKEDCKVILNITIPKEEVKQEFDKNYNLLRQRTEIPGFRKGKVPRQILEARYGPSVEKKVLENLFTINYSQAIKENNIPVLSHPKIEEIKYDKQNEPVSFKVLVEIKPTIEISNYKGIELKKNITNISDKDIENGLRTLQEKYGRIEVVDKPVGENSIIFFDFESFKDGNPIPNGSHKDVLLEMGKNIFPPEFERQLLGMRKGMKKRFKIKIPKDYFDPNIAGQKTTFEVTINEVKERILPALDDEFAKNTGEFNTIEELREAFKKDLIAAAEFNDIQKLKEEIITILSSQYNFPLPQILIEREIDYMLFNLHSDLKSQGLKFDDYLKEKNMTIESCRDEFRPKAMEKVKKFLILDAIAQKENINLDEDEYEKYIKDNFREEPSKIKEYLENNQLKTELKETLRIQKTLDFLIKFADIK